MGLRWMHRLSQGPRGESGPEEALIDEVDEQRADGPDGFSVQPPVVVSRIAPQATGQKIGHPIGCLDRRGDFLLVHRWDKFVARRDVAAGRGELTSASRVFEADPRAFLRSGRLARRGSSAPARCRGREHRHVAQDVVQQRVRCHAQRPSRFHQQPCLGSLEQRMGNR